MKDAIQHQGQEISVIIYDSPLPPRYLRFSKKFIKLIFFLLPIFISIAFFGILNWGLSSRLKQAPSPSLPNIMSDTKTIIVSLETEITELKSSLEKMSDKLSTQPISNGVDDPYLMAIKKPYGMQNFISQKKITLENFQFVPEAQKISFKFQIISYSPEVKVTGHIIVFMSSKSGLMAYPMEANASMGQGIKYSMGEPFAVSRLRPTNAEFFDRPTGDQVKFHIYIFSREGDLLLTHETENYKIGAIP